MARKRGTQSTAPDRGRCAYCSRVSAVPVKVAYELSTDGSSGRLPHHRRRVFLEGVEILPLCELAARAWRSRRRSA